MSEAMIAKESVIEAKVAIESKVAIEVKESAIDAKVAIEDKVVIEDKESIHPAIQYIYEKCKQFIATNPKRLDYDIEIPVKKIDGIEVEIFLRFSLYRINCALCVHSYMIYDEDNNLTTYFKEPLLDRSNYSSQTENSPIEYTIDNITEIYNNCNAILSKLKFNRLSGEMYKNDINPEGIQFGIAKLKAMEAWTSDLENNDNLETMYKTCPVCFELTKTRTNCKHPLCIICWEGICWANSSCDTHICPTCKEELNNHDHIFDRIFRERDSDSGDEDESQDCNCEDCKGEDCNSENYNGEDCNSEDCNGEDCKDEDCKDEDRKDEDCNGKDCNSEDCKDEDCNSEDRKGKDCNSENYNSEDCNSED